MKKNHLLLLVPLFLGGLWGCGGGVPEADYVDKKIVANPMNLNYRFQFDNPSRREAADPVCEYFKGKYYLFASKSGGYWSSEDLAEWTYIPCKSMPMEAYAPTILALNDTLYFMASGRPAIYRNAHPDNDTWERVDTKFEYSITDPAFYQDEDGKVYLYWGCSDKDPIMGVEVDPKNGFKSIGEPEVLIEHNTDKYGWEIPGNKNDEPRVGWNEGPCMVKRNGKYYLQYAAPGTEYRTYGDGIYIGDNPLGPYTYMENSPFSFKPGGFIGGAGHGHTFQDKYGNYWHVASMTIAVRHMFERRLGLFPVYFAGDGHIYEHTVFSDYPYYIPHEKVDFNITDCSMGWNMLSWHKNASASSALEEFGPENAVDEQVETWWASATGDAGEWLQVDLGRKMTVNAIQVNFSDQDFTLKAANSYFNYQYYIEFSDNGRKWERIVDRTANTKDMVHELIVLDRPVKTRYLRITNAEDMEGKFSVSGFRVFGSGMGKVPEAVTEFPEKHGMRVTKANGTGIELSKGIGANNTGGNGGNVPKNVSGFTVTRNPQDARRIEFKWDGVNDEESFSVGIGAQRTPGTPVVLPKFTFGKQKRDGARGYIIKWGIDPSRLNNAVMIYSNNSYEAGFFNRDTEYYFSIDSFNENGVTPGVEVIKK